MIRKEKLSLLKRELGKSLRLNEPLGRHTTFNIGGPADLFYQAKNSEEVIKAVNLCRQEKIPYFVLGGGSNLLVSDEGFRGMVIKVENGEWRVENGKIVAEAGTLLAKLVDSALENSLYGLEFAVGIPGTIGGAVVGNSGTKDRSIGDLTERVKILDEKGKVVVLTNSDCQFSYRSSLFQEKKVVILDVVLKLNRGNKQAIKNKISQYLAKRKNQPKEPSAGSIFINPLGKSAGELIEKVGLKGETIGRAQISEKHANYIVNLGGASCQDVIKLISLAKKRVKEELGIELREEIQVLGRR